MKYISRLILLAMLLGLAGCGKEPSAAEDDFSANPRLPQGLKKLQGLWESRSDTSLCTAKIDGYTIRLTYKDSGSETQFKRNARIEELDADNRRLQVHGDKEPWTYLLEKHNTHVCLELQFYDVAQRKWMNFSLEQPVDSALVTQL
ncbi:hypothetical protein P4C99_09260 [Pontiellaceae bacterium B1224]|nr:hypothetical protein [Pontiellaceae bacterium B1224]